MKNNIAYLNKQEQNIIYSLCKSLKSFNNEAVKETKKGCIVYFYIDMDNKKYFGKKEDNYDTYFIDVSAGIHTNDLNLLAQIEQFATDNIIEQQFSAINKYRDIKIKCLKHIAKLNESVIKLDLVTDNVLPQILNKQLDEARNFRKQILQTNKK